jgi:hypothetical protein
MREPRRRREEHLCEPNIGYMVQARRNKVKLSQTDRFVRVIRLHGHINFSSLYSLSRHALMLGSSNIGLGRSDDVERQLQDAVEGGPYRKPEL